MTKIKDLEKIIQNEDIEVYNILNSEIKRQTESLELIASENFVSRAVLAAASSTFTNKYAEGYPKKRYYNGCEFADEIEELAINRIKKLFSSNYANVQPHSGSQANMAAMFAFINTKDTILGMDLNQGGHLTHGSKVNFSGKLFNVVSYGVRKEDHLIDFDDLYNKAKTHKPKLIISGFSAYPRTLDFKKFKEIADDVGAFLMADIAHISGLVATGEHPTSIGVADVTTSTTHKTLRGPRGGIILSNKEEDAKRINSQIFPGFQGGPLMHIIASKAVSFGEALKPEFKTYIQKVKKNAVILAETFMSLGLNVVSKGTDNHIVLIDLSSLNLTGDIVTDALHEVGITANKNAVPFDTKPPTITSGVRFGTPALTTRGFGEKEFQIIANLIVKKIKNLNDKSIHEQIKNQVKELTESFPMDNFNL